jgi:FkbM family methyltransferase
LKIIWQSNSPYVQTGYGNQTDIATRWLKQHGHEVYIAGFHGHSGAILNFNGIPVLPSSMEQWGNDVILAHYDYYRPDVYFMLMDSWVLNKNVLDALPAAVWSPVDSTPISPPVFEALTHVRWPVAMSRHGERQMRYAGLDPLYVPHMVETSVYKPVDRAQARATYGFTEKQFVAVTVAANKGTPSRKGLDRLLCAWSHFVRKNPNSILYMHTNPYPMNSGLDLMEICAFYDLRYHEGNMQPGHNLDGVQVVFPDQYRMIRGDYDSAALNNLYNAADVFILPSAGEGFGIPVIEAQAAGCPVIVTDFTALHELGEAGYCIPIDPIDDLVVTLHGTHQCQPKISEIVAGLEWGLHFRGDDNLRQKAREFALGYDVETVMNRHMLPALKVMAQGNADYMQFQEYRRKRPDVPRPSHTLTMPPDGRETAVLPECRAKGHDWSPTGVWDGKGELCVPCRRAGCEAELRKTASGWLVNPTGFKEEVNGIALDIEDDPAGGVAKIIMREIEQNYDLDEIDFQPGDKVIDIGAHVGIVSIYLAKKHPEITIYAYEPVPENFERLKRNIEANQVRNITALNYAITADGRDVLLSGDIAGNSGGSSMFATPNGHTRTVKSGTLPTIISTINGGGRIKLLKIDCEGCEFEILQSAGELLRQVDHIRGEFHSNDRLRAMGCDPMALDKYCEQFVADVKVNACDIAS